MALLNYSSGYEAATGIAGISQYLGISSSNTNYLKIFISPDTGGAGHFITHGFDLTPTYNNSGSRGLVPANGASDKTKTFLRGDGWHALWTSAAEAASAGNGTAEQQTANIQTYLQSTLVSAYDIKQWIAQSFAANDAMRFKGTITVNDSNIIFYNDGSNHNGFPTTCEVGDTYKVSNTTNKSLLTGDGTTGQNVNSGDMLVCIKSGDVGGSIATINTSEYWTIVESNIEHIVSNTINGVSYYTYSTQTNSYAIYAPASAGTLAGLVVVWGNDNVPIWASPSTLEVGSALKTKYKLTVGSGLQLDSGTDFDGSADRTISLKVATTSAIGGVIIDNGTNSQAYINNNNTGSYPTISIVSSGTNVGQIYLTHDNVVNALGFTPGSAVGQVGGVIASNAADSTANPNTNTTDPYINIIDGGTTHNVLGSYRLLGSGNIGVVATANTSNVTISLGEADSNNYGGIKIGYTAPSGSPKNYALELDSNGKAYVNVPWVSDVFTTSADGLAPAASNDNKTHNNGGTTIDNVLTNTTYVLGDDAKWYKLPASAFVGTWRNIKVNGTEVLDNTSTGNNAKALDLIAGTNVTLTVGTSSDLGKVTISSSWRNVLVTQNSGQSTTISTIGDKSLVFDNSDSIYIDGTVDSNDNTKMVVKAYVMWQNLDDNTVTVL